MRMSGKLFAPLAVLALAACGRGDTAAPPEASDLQGARGTVEAPGMQTDPPGLSGGPAGQTPGYGQPGGAPAESQSQKDAVGPSTGSDTPPL